MKKGTTDHPKMKTLARILRVPIPTAIGTLQLLWEFTANYAPDGGVGKFTNEHIAEACAWEGTADTLVSALSDARCQWLDADDLFRLVVHDWPDHCEDSVHSKIARAKRFFANAQPPKLSRLAGTERTEAAKFYKDNPRPCARQALDSARDVRLEPALDGARDEQLPALAPSAPTLPSPTLPCPTLPSQATHNSAPWISLRFQEWMDGYRGRKVEPEKALRMWLSRIDTVDDENSAFACRDRYNASDEVSRGIIQEAHNFIAVQADNVWKGEWKTARTNPKEVPYEYKPLPNLMTAERIEAEKAERRRRVEADAATA